MRSIERNLSAVGMQRVDCGEYLLSKCIVRKVAKRHNNGGGGRGVGKEGSRRRRLTMGLYPHFPGTTIFT